MPGQFLPLSRQRAVTHAPFLFLSLALAGCGQGSVKETLGLDRKPPDEFRVVARPPLSVPPDFSLRPPAEGSEVTGSDVPASKQAQGMVFGTEDSSSLRSGGAETAVMSVSSRDADSAGDTQLLQRAGAGNADSGIREKIRAETPVQEDKTYLEKLREPVSKETTVNPKAEKERLEKAKAEGKPVTEGETPVVKPKNRGIFDKIF